MPKIIHARSVSKRQAKKEILKYYEKFPDKEMYPSDVALALKLDSWLVFTICEELTKEGKLE